MTRWAVLSVLIVDGSAVVRDTIIRHLRAHGFETHGASDGEEAVELLQAVDIDAIVLDVALKHPGDGLGLLQTVRRDEYFKVCPVVVYTPCEDQEEIGRIHALGVSAVLDKTLNTLDDLARAVHEAISSGGQGVTTRGC